MVFTWRRLDPADFGMLSGWLEQPHVARWWNHETEPAAVERDFGPSARGEEPNEDLLALLDGVPIGLVQRSRLADYPEYFDEFAAVVDVPPDAMTIDYLIGDEHNAGQGLGTRMIAAIVEQTWLDYPAAPAIIVAVAVANPASWRALEKAGAVRIATADMEPDNPIDDPAHYIYRFDRPLSYRGDHGGDATSGGQRAVQGEFSGGA